MVITIDPLSSVATARPAVGRRERFDDDGDTHRDRVRTRRPFLRVKVVWHSNLQIEVPDHRIRLQAAGLFLRLFCLPVFRTGQSAIASSMARHPQVAHTSEQRSASLRRVVYAMFCWFAAAA